MNRVLVIGERPEEAQALAFRLGLLGYETTPSASEIALALRAAYAFKPDAIVLQAGANGAAHDVFQMLQQVSQTPTIVLAQTTKEEELVWYLDEGAAAYLPAPVSPTLLSAQLATVLRRAVAKDEDGVLGIGDVSIDLLRHKVSKNGVKVQLTPTEFRLLKALAEHGGRPCSRTYLLKEVWGEDFAHCSHYLRLYIGYLRQKLEDDPGHPQVVLTEWGLGYRLAMERAGAPLPRRVVNPQPVALD